MYAYIKQISYAPCSFHRPFKLPLKIAIHLMQIFRKWGWFLYSDREGSTRYKAGGEKLSSKQTVVNV